MTTTLPPDTPFVVRERGGYGLWRVADSGIGYTGVRRPLRVGEVVHLAVWKGDRLESRQTYTLREGDAAWVDTGIHGIDFGQPVDLIFGHAQAAETIWENRITGGPVWLREATP